MVPYSPQTQLIVLALLVFSAVTLTEADSEPVFIRKPDDQIGISGGVASFVCQATGDPKPRITWMKKGKKSQLTALRGYRV